ncbi:hypothetical protein Peur_021906 [Populus x canadensis]
MAKEAELKKIELKVSVNCCDGCKRKVKKALQGVEGVLKTEIDPQHPKVTVLGNVNPQILIKRLLKTGKQAELWSSGNQNAGKEKKEADMLVEKVEKEKDKSKIECEQTKSSDSCVKVTDKNRETKNGGDGGENKASKDCNETDVSVKSSNPEVVRSENPVPPHPEVGNFRTYNQYCYKVEPYAIALPFYAIPSYTVPPVNPTGGQEYLLYERPVFQPPVQTPTARVEDYFSDENTVGCHVM